MDEQHVRALQALRRALIDGEESGAPVPFSIQEIIYAAKHEVGLMQRPGKPVVSGPDAD